MLKRSFAEFHAQRAAPEALEGLRLGQQRLAALHARPWPTSFLGTSREAVERYFALSQRIEALSVKLQVIFAGRHLMHVIWLVIPKVCKFLRRLLILDVSYRKMHSNDAPRCFHMHAAGDMFPILKLQRVEASHVLSSQRCMVSYLQGMQEV